MKREAARDGRNDRVVVASSSKYRLAIDAVGGGARSTFSRGSKKNKREKEYNARIKTSFWLGYRESSLRVVPTRRVARSFIR